MTRGDLNRRPVQRIFLLLAALIVLAGCDSPLGGRHYLPADTRIDPYQTLRAHAEQYYEAGLSAEKQGNLNQALSDYRQARQWDRDGREDIASALNRVEADVGQSSQGQPTATSSAPSMALRPFHSQVFPYSISYPAAWTTKQDRTGDQPDDTFLSPASSTSSTVVLITVDPSDFGTTLDELFVGSKRSLEANGVTGVQLTDRRQVGGQPAYVMSYQTTSSSSQISVLHALFVTPSRAWNVIMLATPSLASEMVTMFDAMLDSLTFEASAFPVQ